MGWIHTITITCIYTILWCDPAVFGFRKSATQPSLPCPIMVHSTHGLFGNLVWASPGRYDLVSYIFRSKYRWKCAFFGFRWCFRWQSGCIQWWRRLLAGAFSQTFLRLHFWFSVIFFSIFTAMVFGCVITPFLRFHYFPSFVFEFQVFLYFSTMVNISAASSLMGREDPVVDPFFQAPNPPNPQLSIVKICVTAYHCVGWSVWSTAENEEKSSNVEVAQIEKHDVHHHYASSTSEDALLEEAMKQFKTNTFSFHVNLFPSPATFHVSFFSTNFDYHFSWHWHHHQSRYLLIRMCRVARIQSRNPIQRRTWSA